MRRKGPGTPTVHSPRSSNGNGLSPVSCPDDIVLIEQICLGQNEALGTLFCRYWLLIFTIAQRILRNTGEAEDLTQEVFLEISRKAHLYDPNRGTVKIWLLQYAYHRSFNRRKYLSLRGFYDVFPNTPSYQPEHRTENVTVSHDWREALKRGMNELPDKQRKLIELVAFEGLTLREASARLEDSYASARNRYYRGLQKLRRFLMRREDVLVSHSARGFAGSDVLYPELIGGR